MPIPFTCPHCGKSTVVDDQFAGQSGPCSACGKTITVPFGAAAAKGFSPGAAGAAAAGAGVAAAGAGIGIVLAILAAVVIGGGCVIGILVALLLPAVQAAREAGRRSEASNDLKQIVLALHNYHDTYNEFPPPVVTDASGKPLYSWRVVILPFMEQQALYNQFDKSKAWDDPANMTISNTKLDVYQSPSDESLAPNGTNYFVLVGPDTVFPDYPKLPKRKMSIAGIPDGTSNTIAIIETKGIPGSWAAPIDPTFDSVNLRIGTGPGEIKPVHPGGTQVALADGSVRFLSQTIDPETLRRLFLRNDGQVINVPY